MRRRALVLTVCLLGVAGLTLAQETVETVWTAEYELVNPLLSAYPVDMAATDSGGVLVLGALKDDEWRSDVLLLKYDASGNLLWSTTYDSPGHGDDDPVGLVVDSLGNAFVVATTEGSDELTNILLLKFNGLGELLWAQQFDGPAHKDDDATALALYPDGGVVVTGSSMVSGFYPDLVVLRYTAEGCLRWSAYLDGSGHQTDEGEDVVVDAEGNVLVAGTAWAGGNGNDIVVAKFSPEGAQVWCTVYDSPEHRDDVAVGGALFRSGGLVVTGVMGGSDDEGDVLTLCVDADGVLKWVQRYHSQNGHQDQPVDVAVDSAGNALVAGTAGSALYDVNGDYVTLKYDSSGAQQWVETYDLSGDWDHAAGLAVDSVGSAYVTGSATDANGRTVIATVKYAPNGLLAWETTYVPQGEASAAKIAVGKNGSVFVTGSVSENKMRTKIVTIKYRQSGTLVPVELVGLDVHPNANGVVLTWETKSERQNYGFEVQRQRNARGEWTSVGFVRGFGTTEQTRRYSFVDRSVPGSGLYRYRLKQVDVDGSWSLSQAVSVFVSLPNSTSLLVAYPNPFNAETVLRYEVRTRAPVRLTIFDAYGRKVARLVDAVHDPGKYRAVWRAEDLASGVYFARLQTPTQSRVTKLILLR